MAIVLTQVSRDGSSVRLRVDGQVSADSVRYLREACRGHRQEGLEVTLDLGGVTFVGPAGAEALRDLRAQGVRVDNVPTLLADLFD